jgi:hypothetical protein
MENVLKLKTMWCLRITSGDVVLANHHGLCGVCESPVTMWCLRITSDDVVFANNQ